MTKPLCALLTLLLLALTLTACRGDFWEHPPWEEAAAETPPAVAPPPRPAESDSGGAAPPTVRQVPLAQFLHEEKALRESGGLTSDLVQYKAAENADFWLGKCESGFKALAEAGAMPAIIWQKVQFYTARGDATYTVTNDSSGAENVTCNFGTGLKPPHFVQCGFEPSGGKVYGVTASLPFAHALEADARDEMALAALGYMGLDVFGDWQKQVYMAAEGDLPSDDTSGFMSVFTSENAGLRFTLSWQCEAEDYLMFSYYCTAEEDAAA